MPKMKRFKTDFPGVTYYEHATREYGINRPDRYYTIRYYVNGRQVEEGLGWSSEKWTPEKANIERAKLREAARLGKAAPKTLAEKRHVEAARQKAEQEAAERAKAEAITFQEFFENDYFPTTERLKNHKTIRAYYKNWINPCIGHLEMRNVGSLDLERIRKKMEQKGRAVKTIHSVMAIIQRVFTVAEEYGKFHGKNPVRNGIKKKLKFDNRRIRFLTRDEVEMILAECNRRNLDDLSDLILASLHTAARAGELFKLEWSDINFESKIISFRDPKNIVTKHTPISDTLWEILQRRKEESTSEFVFPARGGKQRTEVSNTFARIVKFLGLNDGITDRRKKAVFHSLRHTAASWLVGEGIPLYTVQRYLGHSQISLTERYSHLSDDNLRAATRVFDTKQAEPVTLKERVVNIEKRKE